jgi:hypothetical protein
MCDLENNTIFVSIPSYRDPDCVETIKDLFIKATNKKNIYVGVCVQDDTPFSYNELGKERVTIIQVGTEDAQGPCLARYIIETAIYAVQSKRQQFYLTIDAHTLFAPGWDDMLVEEWCKTNDVNAILTTYPREYGVGKVWTGGASSFLTASTWNIDKFPLFKLKPTLGLPMRNMPVPSIGWVAGLSFCLGDIILRVPYLQNVPYSFIGEEMAMAVKYYTHGYNFYAPSQNILQTTYRYGERPRFTTTIQGEKMRLRQKSNLRLLQIVRGEAPKEEYGTVRPIIDFYKYSGINCITQKFSRNATLGITAIDSDYEKTVKLVPEKKIMIKNIPLTRPPTRPPTRHTVINKKEKIKIANPLIGPPQRRKK